MVGARLLHFFSVVTFQLFFYIFFVYDPVPVACPSFFAHSPPRKQFLQGTLRATTIFFHERFHWWILSWHIFPYIIFFPKCTYRPETLNFLTNVSCTFHQASIHHCVRLSFFLLTSCSPLTWIWKVSEHPWCPSYHIPTSLNVSNALLFPRLSLSKRAFPLFFPYLTLSKRALLLLYIKRVLSVLFLNLTLSKCAILLLLPYTPL